jgi:hypothetical protein
MAEQWRIVNARLTQAAAEVNAACRDLCGIIETPDKQLPWIKAANSEEWSFTSEITRGVPRGIARCHIGRGKRRVDCGKRGAHADTHLQTVHCFWEAGVSRCQDRQRRLLEWSGFSSPQGCLEV